MKKFKFVLLTLALILNLSACQKDDLSRISDDQVYFFYQTTCPHCHHAMDYINKKYPNLKIISVNIANKEGFELFEKCARKFNLTENLGTPLFCVGDNFLMGWGPAYEQKFDAYVKPFLKD